MDHPERGRFDNFATGVAGFVSRAPFFVACVALVLIWAPSYFIIRDLNLYQLIINTLTTIVTFLMVAIIQNSQSRDSKAKDLKLNAIAEGVADLLDNLESQKSTDDAHTLRQAVGIEERVGT